MTFSGYKSTEVAYFAAEEMTLVGSEFDPVVSHAFQHCPEIGQMSLEISPQH